MIKIHGFYRFLFFTALAKPDTFLRVTLPFSFGYRQSMYHNNRSNTDNLLFIIQCYALKVPSITGNDPIDFISNLLVVGGKKTPHKQKNPPNCKRAQILNLNASVHEKMHLDLER